MMIPLRAARFKEEAHIPGQTGKAGIGSELKAPEDHVITFDTAMQVVVIEHRSGDHPAVLVPMANTKHMVIEPLSLDAHDAEWARRLVEHHEQLAALGRGRLERLQGAPTFIGRVPAKAAEPDEDAKALAELEAEEEAAREAATKVDRATPAPAATSPETPSARTVVVAKDAKTGKAKGKLDVGDPEDD